jgi:hypothetical protein
VAAECIHVRMIVRINCDYSPSSTNQLVLVMERHCVLLEVITEILTIIYINFMLQRVKVN